MAKTSKSKRTTSRSRSKKAGAALVAATSDVRKAEPRRKGPRRPEPTVPMAAAFAFLGRVMDAYAELPFQLARCRTPMDLMQAQARFAQRIFRESKSARKS